MDVAELVRTITAEVLRRLTEAQPKTCVMVVSARDEQTATQVREALGEEADLVFYGESTHGRAINRCILPSLSCTAMADLAAGRAGDPCTAEVLNLLLAGTKVEVLAFDYTRHSATAPHALYALYEGYAKTLATYGLHPFKIRQPDTLVCREELVTEAVVQAAHNKGATKLSISPAALVTPLAAETAKNLHMQIRPWE